MINCWTNEKLLGRRETVRQLLRNDWADGELLGGEKLLGRCETVWQMVIVGQMRNYWADGNCWTDGKLFGR